MFKTMLNGGIFKTEWLNVLERFVSEDEHCVKSVQMRSYFLSEYSVWIQENTDQK